MAKTDLPPLNNLSDQGLTTYLKDISQYPLLSLPEEKRLAKLAAKPGKKGADARQLLVASNLRLVVTIAREYQNYGLDLLDLISEGNIGCVKAAERYRLEKGAKFSSYAGWWIRQSIRRALSNQSHTIRVPIHYNDKVSKIRKIVEQMTPELGREPTNEEIAEETCIPVEKIKKLREHQPHVTSLDTPIGEDGNDTLGEIISDPNAIAPDQESEKLSSASEVFQLLKYLTPREKEILTLRYGLNGEEPKTLEQVGTKFRLTRERIRQVQDKSLRKLQRLIHQREKNPEKDFAAVFSLALRDLRKHDENTRNRRKKANQLVAS